jgi:16S rRNA G527 N7-methylase RsmG
VRNLLAQHTRVEALHAPPSYDLVLFKAVGKIDACLRWAQHAVARGGAVVLYKTPNVTPEEDEAGQHVCARLGYREGERFDYTLQCRDETLERTLRVFRRE